MHHTLRSAYFRAMQTNAARYLEALAIVNRIEARGLTLHPTWDGFRARGSGNLEEDRRFIRANTADVMAYEPEIRALLS